MQMGYPTFGTSGNSCLHFLWPLLIKVFTVLAACYPTVLIL